MADVMPGDARRTIPDATVARLPVYLRVLYELAGAKLANVSSERLAELAGVNAAMVRKDLSQLGSYGTRGVGYDVDHLMYEITSELGLTEPRPIVVVGAGNLGRALANYGGFDERGYPVAGVVDVDAAVIGREVYGMTVRHIDELAAIVGSSVTTIGVIATPASGAQEAADRLVAAGVRSILNFAPVVLSVPPSVSMRKVDLAVELQILSFYQRRSETDGAVTDGSPD